MSYVQRQSPETRLLAASTSLLVLAGCAALIATISSGVIRVLHEPSTHAINPTPETHIISDPIIKDDHTPKSDDPVIVNPQPRDDTPPTTTDNPYVKPGDDSSTPPLTGGPSAAHDWPESTPKTEQPKEQLFDPIAARLISGNDNFGESDYPSSAINMGEQGVTTATYTVAPDGSVEHCSTDGAPSRTLAAATCKIILSRFRFSPARDVHGHAVAEVRRQRIKWELPE